MNTLAIKNLSIALEALSRIHNSRDQFQMVESLLDREITIAKERRKPADIPSDDDIPF